MSVWHNMSYTKWSNIDVLSNILKWRMWISFGMSYCTPMRNLMRNSCKCTWLESLHDTARAIERVRILRLTVRMESGFITELDGESVVDYLLSWYLFLGSYRVSFFSIFLSRIVQGLVKSLWLRYHFLHQVHYLLHLFVVIWYFYTTLNAYWMYTRGCVEMMM